MVNVIRISPEEVKQNTTLLNLLYLKAKAEGVLDDSDMYVEIVEDWYSEPYEYPDEFTEKQAKLSLLKKKSPLNEIDKGLKQWFREDWVDISRPKKDGGYEPCGRPDSHKGHYPKCVPAIRAKNMTPEQIESAIRRKRSAEAREIREDKKPIMVETIKKENVPTNPELYAKVKAEAKKKFDVYPSAYANGWLVQEYKRRGGKYRVEKGESAGHPFRGNQWVDGVSSGKTSRNFVQIKYGKNTPEVLASLALGGGFTFNTKRGQIRATGVAVAIEKKYELKIPIEKFKILGSKIVRDYAQKHREELSKPNAHVGAWLSKSEGKLYVYLDISVLKTTLEEAAELARANDQIGIFDLSTYTTWERESKGGKYFPVVERKLGGREFKYLDRTAIGKAQMIGGVTFLTLSDCLDNNILDEFVVALSNSEPIEKGESAGHPFRGNQHTGGISAGVSNSDTPHGSVDIEYGELSFNVPASDVDATDKNWENAYDEFCEWQGNYRMRHASAALMEIKSPMAQGGKVGDVGANEIIRTGKLGTPLNGKYSVDDAIQSVINAHVGLKRVEVSPPTTLPLYRGMVVDGKSSILSSPIGEEFVMPLTSFSYSKLTAMEFAGGGFSYYDGDTDMVETVIRSSVVDKPTPVLVVLRQGARAADGNYTDSAEINGKWVEVPFESVTQGNFRIVSRRKVMLPEGSGFRIEIEQIGVYSMDKNTFISKMTQEIPDWVWQMNGSFAQKVSKGESAGHPFRGNQYVAGRSAPKDPTKGSQGGGSAGDMSVWEEAVAIRNRKRTGVSSYSETWTYRIVGTGEMLEADQIKMIDNTTPGDNVLITRLSQEQEPTQEYRNAKRDYLDSTQVTIDRIRQVARQLEEDQNWLAHFLTGSEIAEKQRSINQSQKELEELGAKRISSSGDIITFDGDYSKYQILGGKIEVGDKAKVISPAWSWRDKGSPEGFFRIKPDEPAVIVSQGAIIPVVSKGESAGHPFRGNQWVAGKSSGRKISSSKPNIAPVLKTRLTVTNKNSAKADKVREYMLGPASRFKNPMHRRYAKIRVQQMTSGVARPSGMSKKYGMSASEVRTMEIVLSKIFRYAREKFGI